MDNENMRSGVKNRIKFGDVTQSSVVNTGFCQRAEGNQEAEWGDTFYQSLFSFLNSILIFADILLVY
jgi:hypothetical protein